VKVYDCAQGEAEWLQLRVGKVTASELGELVTPLFTARKGETPHTYLCKKVAEAYRGKPLPDDQFYSHDTEQGQMLEDEARRCFVFTFDHDKISHPGFCEHDGGRFGCSPDALLGDDGGLEIKCPKAKTHVKYLINGELPDDYAAQVHGCMFVTGRPKWTFLSYHRSFPPFVIEVMREERIIESITLALSTFEKAFDEAFDKLNSQADEPKRNPFQ